LHCVLFDNDDDDEDYDGNELNYGGVWPTSLTAASRILFASKLVDWKPMSKIGKCWITKQEAA